MSDSTEDYFWDKVCQGGSREDFFSYLAKEQPTLRPCRFCQYPASLHFTGEMCTRLEEKNKQCSPEVYEKITKVLQHEMLSRHKNETEEKDKQKMMISHHS